MFYSISYWLSTVFFTPSPPLWFVSLVTKSWSDIPKKTNIISLIHLDLNIHPPPLNRKKHWIIEPIRDVFVACLALRWRRGRWGCRPGSRTPPGSESPGLDLDWTKGHKYNTGTSNIPVKGTTGTRESENITWQAVWTLLMVRVAFSWKVSVVNIVSTGYSTITTWCTIPYMRLIQFIKAFIMKTEGGTISNAFKISTFGTESHLSLSWLYCQGFGQIFRILWRQNSPNHIHF